MATGIENRYPEKYIYGTFPILDIDTEDITNIFDDCFEFIDQGRGGKSSKFG